MAFRANAAMRATSWPACSSSIYAPRIRARAAGCSTRLPTRSRRTRIPLRVFHPAAPTPDRVRGAARGGQRADRARARLPGACLITDVTALKSAGAFVCPPQAGRRVLRFLPASTAPVELWRRPAGRDGQRAAPRGEWGRGTSIVWCSRASSEKARNCNRVLEGSEVLSLSNRIKDADHGAPRNEIPFVRHDGSWFETKCDGLRREGRLWKRWLLCHRRPNRPVDAP